MSRTRWALVALACGAMLRLTLLGAKSLWFDEASTLVLAGHPLSGLASALMKNEVNPPLYYVLMHFWLKAFPDPRIALRLFSALCGIASLAVFRAIAWRLLPEKSRLVALWLAAGSSFWIHVAQDGRSYSLLLLISLLSSWAVLELAERPRRRVWAFYALVAAAGLWTHYYYTILLAGHAAWLAWTLKDRRGLLFWHGAAAAAFLPWVPFFLVQARLHVKDPVVGEALSPFRVLDLLGTTFFDVTFLGLVLPAWACMAAGAMFAGLAAAAVSDALRSAKGSPERRAAGFGLVHVAAGIALVAAVEALGGRPVTQARYFVPLSPALILLAALGARRAWTRVLACVVVAAGAAGYFYSAVTVDPRLGELAAFIRRSTASDVPVVHLGKYYHLPLRAYYLPERRHLLVADQAVGMDYRTMPPPPGMRPYPGVIADKDLPALGPCVVVDEARTLSPDRVRLGTGAQLAAMRR